MRVDATSWRGTQGYPNGTAPAILLVVGAAVVGVHVGARVCVGVAVLGAAVGVHVGARVGARVCVGVAVLGAAVGVHIGARVCVGVAVLGAAVGVHIGATVPVWTLEYSRGPIERSTVGGKLGVLGGTLPGHC
jgi:hypothetical protein